MKRAKPPVVTQAAAEDAVRTSLRWAGEDPKREGLLDTLQACSPGLSGDWFLGLCATDPARLPAPHVRGGRRLRRDDRAAWYRIRSRSANTTWRRSFWSARMEMAGLLDRSSVVGISKLARVVDAYARRFQVQENPHGADCALHRDGAQATRRGCRDRCHASMHDHAWRTQARRVDDHEPDARHISARMRARARNSCVSSTSTPGIESSAPIWHAEPGKFVQSPRVASDLTCAPANPAATRRLPCKLQLRRLAQPCGARIYFHYRADRHPVVRPDHYGAAAPDREFCRRQHIARGALVYLVRQRVHDDAVFLHTRAGCAIGSFRSASRDFDVEPRHRPGLHDDGAGQHLPLLFNGRVSGITAASFSTANAYVADVTPPAQRAAAYGKIGMAFGLGFPLRAGYWRNPGERSADGYRSGWPPV